jgi:hypothetical protein
MQYVPIVVSLIKYIYITKRCMSMIVNTSGSSPVVDSSLIAHAWSQQLMALEGEEHDQRSQSQSQYIVQATAPSNSSLEDVSSVPFVSSYRTDVIPCFVCFPTCVPRIATKRLLEVLEQAQTQGAVPSDYDGVYRRVLRSLRKANWKTLRTLQTSFEIIRSRLESMHTHILLSRFVLKRDVGMNDAKSFDSRHASRT